MFGKTLNWIIAKYKETVFVKNRPGQGQKCKIPKTLERKLMRDIIKNPEIVNKLASSVDGLSDN